MKNIKAVKLNLNAPLTPTELVLVNLDYVQATTPYVHAGREIGTSLHMLDRTIHIDARFDDFVERAGVHATMSPIRPTKEELQDQILEAKEVKDTMAIILKSADISWHELRAKVLSEGWKEHISITGIDAVVRHLADGICFIKLFESKVIHFGDYTNHTTSYYCKSFAEAYYLANAFAEATTGWK